MLVEERTGCFVYWLSGTKNEGGSKPSYERLEQQKNHLLRHETLEGKTWGNVWVLTFALKVTGAPELKSLLY